MLLFAVAAVAEIGDAWLVWQGVRDTAVCCLLAPGIAALAAYGSVATFQPEPHFGRLLVLLADLDA